jgi:hypothetical protein
MRDYKECPPAKGRPAIPGCLHISHTPLQHNGLVYQNHQEIEPRAETLPDSYTRVLSGLLGATVLPPGAQVK